MTSGRCIRRPRPLSGQLKRYVSCVWSGSRSIARSMFLNAEVALHSSPFSRPVGWPLQGPPALGVPKGWWTIFHFSCVGVLCCKWWHCQWKSGGFRGHFLFAGPSDESLVFWNMVLIACYIFNTRWSDSLRKSKWPRHAVFMVSKLPWRTFTLRCTAYLLTRTSRIQKRGKLPKTVHAWRAVMRRAGVRTSADDGSWVLVSDFRSVGMWSTDWRTPAWNCRNYWALAMKI